MRLRGLHVVYGLSALLHGALWFGVTQVEARPPPAKPIRITMRDVPPPPPDEPPPPEPEPEPEPEPAPEPEAAPVELPEPAAPPEPTPPRPKRAKAEPPPADAPAPARAPADVPEFGLQLGNSAGPGGLAVPEGDPGVDAGGEDRPRKRVESKARKLEAKPEKADAGCSEAEQKPRPLELPQPKYSDAARAEGIEGAVRVQLSIDQAGAVTAVKVLKSLHPELDEAARRAVEAARFSPATRCGAAVATTITISIKFSL